MWAQRILRPSKQFRFLQILVSNDDKTILVMCVSQKEILCRRTNLNNFQPTIAFKIFIMVFYRAYYIYLWKLFSNF